MPVFEIIVKHFTASKKNEVRLKSKLPVTRIFVKTDEAKNEKKVKAWIKKNLTKVVEPIYCPFSCGGEHDFLIEKFESEIPPGARVIDISK